MEAEIREDYLESLEELTVASRPIIKTLTEIAQENADNATAIVDAIDHHSVKSPPKQKLPALYLIDSICKNVGEPYTSSFAPRIPRIFSNAFETTGEPTRMKLNEQFKTWTFPNEMTGEPLFPHEVSGEINGFMVSQQMTRDAQILPPQPPRGGPQRLNQSALSVEMNRYRSTLEQDPADAFTEKQIQMLNRFEAQVSGVVDPKLSPQIQSELENSKASREHYMSRPVSMPSNNNNNNNSNNRRRMDRRDNRRVPSSGNRDQFNNNNSNGNNNNNNNGRQRPYRGGGIEKSTGANNVPSGTRNRIPTPSDHEIAAITDAMHRQPQNEIQNQSNYELESTPDPDSHTLETTSRSHTPAQAPNGMPMPMPPMPPMGLSMPPIPPMSMADMMMGMTTPSSATGSLPGSGSAQSTPEPELPDSDLETASKLDATSEQIAQLYSAGLPSQCSTCGYRFKDTENGREAKQAEMDWHFRANKDIREGHSRSRCRFLSATQWIKYRDEDEVFGSGSQASGEDSITSNGTSDAPVDLDKEREKYIEVPMDSNEVCPVCQEPHETSWSEEAENWVWMNTVDVNGLYFHATCYTDPQNKDLVASVLDNKPA